jgi:hypothetical protein
MTLRVMTERETAMNEWMKLATLGATLLLSACVAQAQTAPATMTEAGHRASASDVAWLAGRWVGEGLGGQMEEVWSPPAGPQMVGHFRLEQDGVATLYEIMLLDEFEGGLRMRVKHFNPTFVGWEEKDAWHTFPFVSAAPGVLLLDGLEFRRQGTDRLIIRLSIGQADGSVETETLNFHRAPL